MPPEPEAAVSGSRKILKRSARKQVEFLEANLREQGLQGWRRLRKGHDPALESQRAVRTDAGYTKRLSFTEK